MRRKLPVTAAALAGLILTLGPPAGAATPPAPPPPAAPTGAAPEAAEPARFQVTLLTGDVIQVEQHPDGRTDAGVVAPRTASTAFRVYERAGHTHVVPFPAQPYLDAGLLDARLFNVTLLVEYGYHDAAADHLPLIIEYGSAPAVAAQVPDGARVHADLPSAGARAVGADKSDIAEVWAGLTGDATAWPATTGLAAPTLSPGIERVWLDGGVTAALDLSVPHTGAPAAWSLGLDGEGVTVAVLDTGIDSDHADLAGAVAAAESFTPDGAVDDRHGHGTHVASIVAGRGDAASGGRAGVAPAADLLVGKVLSDTGFGQESWVIAGMEWAVEAGADVVNLSLGSFPTDGSDPMSRAVDTLSEAGEVLFVVAAGNSGPSPRTVSAPATADAALAVGNTRLDGVLNFSSSRGPRVGDNAIKPEISAPGTGIVAARPGGGHQAMTGTSMAAPHVAGAAAILAQQHPELRGGALKTALVSSTVPLATASVWEQGAGELAIDRAVAQTVRVSHGTLDLGYLELDEDDLSRAHALSYRNHGAEPVTLQLEVAMTGEDGLPAPAGTVTVDPPALTLAPGEVAEVAVRLDAAAAPPGQYAGRVVAHGAGHPVTTAVGYYRQGDLVDITVSLTDRRGEPAGGHVTLLNYELGVFHPDGFFEGGVAAGQARTFRVPRATYSITAQVATTDLSGRFLSELSVVFEPQAEAERNLDLALDARQARPVEARTPRPAAPESVVLAWTRGTVDQAAYFDSLVVLPAAGELEAVSVTPTAPVTDGTFDLYTTFHLAAPWLTAEIKGQRFQPSHFAGSPRYVGQERVEVVDAGTWPAGQDVAGKVALLREDPAVTPFAQAQAAAAEGAVLALVTPDQPGLLRELGFGLPIPAATLSYDDGQRLRQALPGRLHLSGLVDSPYSYDLVFHDAGRAGPTTVRQVRQSDLATVDARYHGDGAGRLALHSRWATAPCQCSLTRVYELHELPYHRTEYLSTGAAVWSADVQFGLTGNLRAWDRGYQPRRYTETWGAAPLAPTAADAVGEVSTRQGDTLRLRVSPIADAEGRAGSSAGTSSGVLYRNGTVEAELFGGFGDVPVPGEEADYRFEVTTTNGFADDGWLSTWSQTSWTFRSGHADPAVRLPLLSPVYQLPVSTDNAIDPRQPVLLLLGAVYPDHTPAKVQAADVWVSYDDGQQWQAVPVLRLPNGRTHAILPAAAQHGHASLRVALSDAEGNTVEQTVLRAYRLAEE